VMCTHERFLKMNIGLGLDLVFLWVCLGLAFYVFFGFSLDYFALVVCFRCVCLVSSVLCQEIGSEECLRNDLFLYGVGRKTLTLSHAFD